MGRVWLPSGKQPGFSPNSGRQDARDFRLTGVPQRNASRPVSLLMGRAGVGCGGFRPGPHDRAVRRRQFFSQCPAMTLSHLASSA